MGSGIHARGGFVCFGQTRLLRVRLFVLNYNLIACCSFCIINFTPLCHSEAKLPALRTFTLGSKTPRQVFNASFKGIRPIKTAKNKSACKQSICFRRFWHSSLPVCTLYMCLAHKRSALDAIRRGIMSFDIIP